MLALDALGVLSHMRPRRAKVLTKNDRLRMGDVEAMCHWAGLTTRGHGHAAAGGLSLAGLHLVGQRVGPGRAAPLSRRPGGGAAFREAARHGAGPHARGRAAAAEQHPPTPTCRPNGLAEGYGSHEISDWALTHDGRNTRLFVALGLRAGASAVTGEAWAMAQACARPANGVRPVPYVAVDRSLAWADGSLAARAAAEAAKLAVGLAFGWIEATANLGVELYDVITVDATDVRVVGITEKWDRGRLRQRLELAEVNHMGVYRGVTT